MAGKCLFSTSIQVDPQGFARWKGLTNPDDRQSLNTYFKIGRKFNSANSDFTSCTDSTEKMTSAIRSHCAELPGIALSHLKRRQENPDVVIRICLAALIALFSAAAIGAQEFGKSVVKTSHSECSECGTGECNKCVDNRRVFPESPNRDVWNGDFFTGCGGGRVDWIQTGEFCSNFYFAGFGGYTNIDNFQQRTVTGNVVDITTAQMLDGFGVGGAVGVQFHPLLRGEFEFTFRDNGAGSWREETFTGGVLTATNTVDLTGSLESYSWMSNMVIDFPPRKEGAPNFYAGGGLGVLYANGDLATATTNYNVSDASFAYQFLAGINVPVRSNVDFFTEYRFLGANNITVDDLTNNISLGDIVRQIDKLSQKKPGQI